MNMLNTRTGRALWGAALLAGTLGGCDFVEPTRTDPNAVPEADLDQLFTAGQVAAFQFNETETARLAAMWMQQMRGTDRQFVTLYNYNFSESDGADSWLVVYRQGGLNELRQAIAIAEARGLTAYKGILQIHEAFLLGMAASIWGDVPDTEAVDPGIEEPKLDPQLQVYEHVQAILSEAITNLQAAAPGESALPVPGVDLNFGGDAASWIPVAHSLKARFYMHVAEVEGASAYQNALQQAQMGIESPANNWLGVHSTTATEANLWNQFQRDRSGYMSPNSQFVGMLRARNDPRREIYFRDFNAAGTEADLLNLSGTDSYDQPIITCAETQFIEAEAALALGMTAVAQQAYLDGIACQEEYFANLGFTIDIEPRPVTLQEIIAQKYIALFLNQEVWNDYKRTCLPGLIPVASTPEGTREIPPGLYYPGGERQTNRNVPSPGTAPNLLRNPNDPNPCT